MGNFESEPEFNLKHSTKKCTSPNGSKTRVGRGRCPIVDTKVRQGISQMSGILMGG